MLFGESVRLTDTWSSLNGQLKKAIRFVKTSQNLRLQPLAPCTLSSILFKQTNHNMFSVGRRQDCLVVNTKLCVMHIRIIRSLQKSLKNQTKQKQKEIDPNTIFFSCVCWRYMNRKRFFLSWECDSPKLSLVLDSHIPFWNLMNQLFVSIFSQNECNSAVISRFLLILNVSNTLSFH